MWQGCIDRKYEGLNYNYRQKWESLLGNRRCSCNGHHGLESVCATSEVVNRLLVIFTNINGKIGGLGLNLSFTKYTRNFKFQVETHVFWRAGLGRWYLLILKWSINIIIQFKLFHISFKVDNSLLLCITPWSHCLSTIL